MDTSVFEVMRKDSQNRRQQNRKNSAKILQEAEVKFTSHNEGAHLVVDGPTGKIDFWPGTGKFIVRGKGSKGRGVFRLLVMLGKNQ